MAVSNLQGPPVDTQQITALVFFSYQHRRRPESHVRSPHRTSQETFLMQLCQNSKAALESDMKKAAVKTIIRWLLFLF